MSLMKKSGARLMATFLALSPGMTLAAQPDMKPPAPAPAYDASALSFFIGTWHGSGQFALTKQPVTSTMTFEQVNRTTVMVKGTEDAPNTYRYTALWSKERGSGQLVMLMSSSFDGPAVFRSPGWNGQRLVFEPASGVDTGASKVRFTYKRTSDTTFDLIYEFSIGDKWLVGDEQTFTKVR